MLVVDTSVWLDFFKPVRTSQVDQLRKAIGTDLIIVGDMVLVEILQGLGSDSEARHVSTVLRNFRIEPMLDPKLAEIAATNYRKLRARGFTIRKTIDLIIGTFCIEHGHVLLHNDRDFEPMQLHLGLRTL